MGSALRTWLIVAATILWVMVSRGRALVARLPWVLAAPALTIIALVLFSIYGAYGGYQALHPEAKTPPDVVAAGIGLGPHARVAARHSLAQHRPEAPRMTLKQDLQTKAVVAVNEYRPGGMLPTGHVNISFFFHGTAQGTFGRNAAGNDLKGRVHAMDLLYGAGGVFPEPSAGALTHYVIVSDKNYHIMLA